ncbi:CRK6 [Symbiodinium natans]|uniref:CRK6 protein n=1 Tax=Symbiodinium natans TaxID=878477 RepID=A0A812NX11_9DINO|nr:CRK6 [Symbiodinium natans]
MSVQFDTSAPEIFGDFVRNSGWVQKIASCPQEVEPERDPEARRQDLEGASDDEIEHDEQEWVQNNLAPSLRYITKNDQPLHVDIRTEMIAKFKLPFKSGDVLMDRADGEQMTCIGVARLPGAGISRAMHQHLGRFKCIGNEPVRDLLPPEDPSGWDLETHRGILASLAGQMCLDFAFPRGRNQAKLDLFDVREEVVQRVTGGWVPGTVLTLSDKPLVRFTLVGLAPDDEGAPKVWWYMEEEHKADRGAGILSGWEAVRSRLRDTGERVDLKADRGAGILSGWETLHLRDSGVRVDLKVLSERLQAGDVAPRRPLQQTQLEKLLSEQVADVDLAYVVRCTENWSDGQMIGEGAYGKVYKGVDKDGTEAAHFAVKRQRCPDDIAARHRLERMRRAEIDTLTHVTHPNIIRLLGYSSGDEDTVLIYEFGQQGSLERTLREDELAAQLGWAWRVRIARGIVAGVQHLHEQQFYHRDVQPAHVVLMEDFTPKLTAFGLSRPFREMDCANEVPKGTPGFMCRHYITTRKFDQKSEVYSVGVTVLQIVTGVTDTVSNTLLDLLDIVDIDPAQGRTSVCEAYDSRADFDESLQPMVEALSDMAALAHKSDRN